MTDDIEHYMKACARLRGELTEAREALVHMAETCKEQRAEITALHAMVAKLEWVDGCGDNRDPEGPGRYCLECGGWEQAVGHDEGCALAALLYEDMA